VVVTDACLQTYVLVTLPRYKVILLKVVQEVDVERSGRDEVCKSVLNDKWVSHPGFSSEDFVSMAHKNYLYEEPLHRTEEECHGYDSHIDALVCTIGLLEPLNHKILRMTREERLLSFASNRIFGAQERQCTNGSSRISTGGRLGSRCCRRCRTLPHWQTRRHSRQGRLSRRSRQSWRHRWRVGLHSWTRLVCGRAPSTNLGTKSRTQTCFVMPSRSRFLTPRVSAVRSSAWSWQPG
jgi:hypothetical protein